MEDPNDYTWGSRDTGRSPTNSGRSTPSREFQPSALSSPNVRSGKLNGNLFSPVKTGNQLASPLARVANGKAFTAVSEGLAPEEAYSLAAAAESDALEVEATLVTEVAEPDIAASAVPDVKAELAPVASEPTEVVSEPLADSVESPAIAIESA